MLQFSIDVFFFICFLSGLSRLFHFNFFNYTGLGDILKDRINISQVYALFINIGSTMVYDDNLDNPLFKDDLDNFWNKICKLNL